jgi:hypothetical protein
MMLPVSGKRRTEINRRLSSYDRPVRIGLHSGYEPLSGVKGLVVDERPDDRDIEDAEIASVDEGAALAIPSALPPEPSASDYTEAGVPTFDYVRDRIEGRIATSVGMAELTGDTPQAASLDEQFAAREQAGKDRLEEIRRAMRGE